MASIHTIGAFPFSATLRDIDRVIFHEWMERSVIGRSIFNVRSSSQYQEDTLTIGGVGIMTQKLEGQPIDYVTNNEGFRNTYTHLDYGSGMRVTRNMLRDDLYASMEKLHVRHEQRKKRSLLIISTMGSIPVIPARMVLSCFLRLMFVKMDRPTLMSCLLRLICRRPRWSKR